MDEEPPVFLAYQPYKGPAAIPHVPGDFFGAFFLATNVGPAIDGSGISTAPGAILSYLIAVADRALMSYVPWKNFWQRAACQEMGVSVLYSNTHWLLLQVLLLSYSQHRSSEHRVDYLAPCCSPDYIASCVNEAAQRRDVHRGQQPRTWLVSTKSETELLAMQETYQHVKAQYMRQVQLYIERPVCRYSMASAVQSVARTCCLVLNPLTGCRVLNPLHHCPHLHQHTESAFNCSSSRNRHFCNNQHLTSPSHT